MNSTFHAGRATGRHTPEVFEMQEIASRADDAEAAESKTPAPPLPAPTPSQQAHELLDALFPRPEHAGNAMRGVVPPAFPYDDRWPDAGEMPDLLGQCGALLGVVPGRAAQQEAASREPPARDTAASPAVVEGTLDELHQVMPYLF